MSDSTQNSTQFGSYDRRTFLGAVGVLSATALAGCPEEDPDEDGNETDLETPPAEESPEPPDEQETPAIGGGDETPDGNETGEDDETSDDNETGGDNETSDDNETSGGNESQTDEGTPTEDGESESGD